MSEIAVGIDIGGTFTDIALERGGEMTTCKVLTDHLSPERAVMQGLEKAAGLANARFDRITRIIHGTTLVSNSLIERRGAKTAFITTEGFRDVIEMRSENRFEQYDLNIRLPLPLVPRRHRFTVAERIAADGTVLLELSDSEIKRAVDWIEANQFESVAIGFLHSYANDDHEKRTAEALRAAIPNLPISLSSVVSPQIRELPRFNTVTANAYVQPRVKSYLDRLVSLLRDSEVECPILILHSGGGLISIGTAIEQPVRLLESGPAGGAIFASQYAKAFEEKKAVSFDMGGTTAKICLMEEGQPSTANTFEVARSSRFKKGSGLTLSTPVVEMIEIGAGGGSIASKDALSRIEVGPRSAGSDPGPACYARGGSEPTVTDANLILGRLDPATFASGQFTIDPELSAAAIQRITDSGSAVSDIAYAITEVVDENMSNAARVHAVEKGEDIEQYSLIAFGGAAPLHACRLCEKLGISRAIIPPGAGVGSAIGFLRAPFSFEVTKGNFQRLNAFSPESANMMLDRMKTEVHGFLNDCNADESRAETLTAFMRYKGQGWEIPVRTSLRCFDEMAVEELQDAFETEYAALFGRTVDGLEIEVTGWSLLAATSGLPIKKPEALVKSIRHPVNQSRKLYDAALRREVDAAEVLREHMNPGCEVEGPAIIVESETATVVTSAFRAIGQHDGSLLLERKSAHGGQNEH